MDGSYLSSFHIGLILQGPGSGWYSLIVGLFILVIFFVCIGVCIGASYYYGTRKEKRPEYQQSTVYISLKYWAAFINGYIFFITLIFGAIFYFAPHLLQPELALPIIGGVILGIFVICLISYYIASKQKQMQSTKVPRLPEDKAHPISCPVCGEPLLGDEKYCGKCGAAID
jgi:hypothetical protein